MWFFRANRYEFRLANELFFSAIEPLLRYDTATFVIQQSLFYTLIAALSDCKRGFIVKHGCCLHGLTQPKTANQNSIINFYFVTCFYSLYDICMGDDKQKNMGSHCGCPYFFE